MHPLSRSPLHAPVNTWRAFTAARYGKVRKQPQPWRRMTQNAVVTAIFQQFDADGSGALDADEVIKLLTKGDCQLSMDDAQEFVSYFDTNVCC